MKSIYKISSFLILTFMSMQSIIFTVENKNILENQNNSLINYNDKEIKKFAKERYEVDINISEFDNHILNCQFIQDIFNKLEIIKENKTEFYDNQILEITKNLSISNNKKVQNSLTNKIKTINQINMSKQTFISKYESIYSKIKEEFKQDNLSLKNIIEKIKDEYDEKLREILRKFNEIKENMGFYSEDESGDRRSAEQQMQKIKKEIECKNLKENIETIESCMTECAIFIIQYEILKEIQSVNKKILKLNNL